MKRIIDIANEYVTQDNVSTRFPIAVALQEKKWVAVPEGCDFERITICDGDCISFYNKEEIWEYYAESNDISVLEAKEDNPHSEHYDDIVDIAELLYPESDIIKERSEYQFSGNIFLTQSGYDKHIKCNRHNLTSPRPYVIHLFRNHEMYEVVCNLMSIATVPEKDWNESALYFYKKYLERK